MDSAKKKMPGKKKAIIAVACVLVVGLAIGIYALNSLSKYKKTIEAIEVRNVDLTAIEDGEYFGDSDAGMVSAKVKVVVKDHAITEIELIEHKNGRGAEAEKLPDEVIRQQRIDVDMVSGATSSSKVILDAIHDALK